MCIFSAYILLAQRDTLHKSEKCASDYCELDFLCFWRAGLCDFDGYERIFQLSMCIAYGKSESEGRTDCSSSDQYWYVKRI